MGKPCTNRLRYSLLLRPLDLLHRYRKIFSSKSSKHPLCDRKVTIFHTQLSVCPLQLSEHRIGFEIINYQAVESHRCPVLAHAFSRPLSHSDQITLVPNSLPCRPSLAQFELTQTRARSAQHYYTMCTRPTGLALPPDIRTAS